MSDTFNAYVGTILSEEGGYSFDSRDPGGETNFGITARVAHANGYVGDMKSMTRDQAIDIYRTIYWQRSGFSLVDVVAPEIAEKLLDCGVNMGVSASSTFLQRLLNALNREQADYNDIRTDGVCGPGTVTALSSFLQKRGIGGKTVLLRGINCLQGARYVSLAEANQTEESFLYGWLQNRINL